MIPGGNIAFTAIACKRQSAASLADMIANLLTYLSYTKTITKERW
jgi:hypothetical protein